MILKTIDREKFIGVSIWIDPHTIFVCESICYSCMKLRKKLKLTEENVICFE